MPARAIRVAPSLLVAATGAEVPMAGNTVFGTADDARSITFPRSGG